MHSCRCDRALAALPRIRRSIRVAGRGSCQPDSADPVQGEEGLLARPSGQAGVRFQSSAAILTSPEALARSTDSDHCTCLQVPLTGPPCAKAYPCLLYTSDAADDLLCVDLGGRRIIKKNKK